MQKNEKSIEEYVFRPARRTDTEDRISTSSRSNVARSEIMAAEEIRFLSYPTVGERALFVTDSKEFGKRVFSTSPVREFVFDGEAGFARIKTLNSVYLFETDPEEQP